MKIGQFFAVALAILLSALAVFPASAIDEYDPILIHACDSIFGKFVVDNSNRTQGTASLRMNLSSAGSFVCEYSIRQPLDLSEADTLALDIYLPNPSVLSKFNSLYLELTSSGTCDHQEIAWVLATIPGTPDDEHPGWVTLYLYFEEGRFTDGKPDYSAINYMRIFGFYDASLVESGDYFLVDNIRACTTGGQDYSGLGFDDYKLSNPDVNIRIPGQTRPELTERDEGITITSGLIRGQTYNPDTPGSDDHPTDPVENEHTVLYIAVSVGIVVLILFLTIAVTLKKKKKAS